MTDEFYSPFHRATSRQPKAGEPLFEFVRKSDGAPMKVELRYHGESYGWEAVILERGELLRSHGAFPTKALANQWAEIERRAIEKGDD